MNRWKTCSQLALKEFNETVRQKSYWIFSMTVFVLFVFAFVLGWKQYKFKHLKRESAAKEVREQWIQQGNKHPHEAAHFGTFAFKEVSPLMTIEKGLYEYLGTDIWLETHKQNNARGKSISDKTYLARFGELTPGFLLQFVVPLLVILLGYNSLSGEREQNTLRLLLSHNLSKKQLFFGKFLGLVYKLLLPLLPFLFFLIYRFVLLKTNGHNTTANISFLIVFYGIYVLIFIFLVLGVSATGNTSRQALLQLFCLWIFFCILVPRFSTSVSEAMAERLSSFELKMKFDQKNNLADVYPYKSENGFDAIFKRTVEKLMKEEYLSSRDSLIKDPFGLALEIAEEQAHEAYDISYGIINRIFEQQNATHQALAFLSPQPNIKFLSMGLTHTDWEAHFHFINKAELFRRKMMKTLNMDIATSSADSYDVETRGGGNYQRGEDFWKKIPQFSYASLPTFKVLNNHFSNLILLLVWFFSTLVFAMIRVKKLKIAL